MFNYQLNSVTTLLYQNESTLICFAVEKKKHENSNKPSVCL